jgi:hypothetical protein
VFVQNQGNIGIDEKERQTRRDLKDWAMLK